MFKTLKFLRDYNIDHAETGNKHCRRGWVQVHCPFCSGSASYHLGINLSKGYGNCYRCKGKSLPAIVQALVNCSWSEAYRIIKEYGGSFTKGSREIYKATGFDPTIEVVLPDGSTNMTDRHKAYLEGRGFDPEWLIEVYDLKGTGPVGDYKHRIVAPIIFDGHLVSYQCRDITGKSDLPYKACAQVDEAMDHKNTLYGIDLAREISVVVVEGIVDKWRLGPGAVATFGTAFKPAQVRMLKERFSKAYLLYDSEDQAQANARLMAHQLAATGMQVENLKLKQGDPGELSQDDADHLMTDLGF